MDILLTLIPVLLVLGLLVVARWPADLSGLAGWLVTMAIAYLFFNTSLQVGLTASLAGLIASFPVSLMVVTSLFQITFLESTGALKRIVVFVKTLAGSDQTVQIMMINMAIGTLLVSVGATPVSILPPIMLALGYSTFVAVALPALGFDALCTYALLGGALVIFSDMTSTPLNEAALVFSQFMPVISTMIGFGMLYIVGGWSKMREGFLPCLLAGLTMGMAGRLSPLPPGWLDHGNGSYGCGSYWQGHCSDRCYRWSSHYYSNDALPDCKRPSYSGSLSANSPRSCHRKIHAPYKSTVPLDYAGHMLSCY